MKQMKEKKQVMMQEDTNKNNEAMKGDVGKGDKRGDITEIYIKEKELKGMQSEGNGGHE